VASDWSAFVDAVLADLTAQVPGLAGALEHRYAPYDPEQQKAEPGERHIAVFPLADIPQQATPFVTAPGGDLLTETYRVLYWEAAGDESTRQVTDEEAAFQLLELAQAVRNRFYVVANLTLSDATQVRYLGAVFPDRSSTVRWFAIGVEATRVKQAT
jgi:hypothetical protein